MATHLTTPPSPVDITARYPMLVPYARQAVRLHPRQGDPGVRDSSMGGPLLWPADEPWPTCAQETCCGPDGLPCIQAGEASPLVPVLQLFARDVPELPFPDGTDLLQMLWCPLDHDMCEPWPLLRWRSEADVVATSTARPDPHPAAPRQTIPSPCTLSPERVTDYPDADLPREAWNQLHTLINADDSVSEVDVYELCVVPGTKVGGHPSWVQDPEWPECSCGLTMTHLLTIASWEYDGIFSSRWIPLEEQPLFDLGESAVNLSAQNQQIRWPHGVMLGDVGNYHVFVCTECPERPYAHAWACS